MGGDVWGPCEFKAGLQHVLDKSQADVVLFERCLPALPHHQASPLMFLPSRSGGAERRKNKGSSLYLKASGDIMEKTDSQSGVGESQRDYCCSQNSQIFLSLFSRK